MIEINGLWLENHFELFVFLAMKRRLFVSMIESVLNPSGVTG
jgi:hypothetical protein